MPATLAPLEAEFAEPVRSHVELPPMVDAAVFCATPIEVPAEIIKGILHQGCKMVIGGSSKARKSWLFLDLAVAVSAGRTWLGHFETAKAKVLYVNFELPTWAIRKRLCEITKAHEVSIAGDTLTIWNLRGHAAPYHTLLPQITAEAKTHGFGLIILDPSYKLLGEADENSARDIASLLNEIERVAVETDAAVAFSAHFAKGNPSQKEAIDRISGSGVFARDPDTILIFTAHKAPDAFAVEAVLRTLPPQKPFAIRWQCPVFLLAEDLNPTDLKESRGNARLSPTREEVLSIFKTDLANPRATLLTSPQLRTEFDSRRWDRTVATAMRDQLEANGKLKIHVEAHNKKLTGLPAMVDAYEKQVRKTKAKQDRKTKRKSDI